MKAALSLTALAAASAAALTAFPAEAQQSRERVRHLIVYGADPCPRAGPGEDIIICARRPDQERFRMPRELRDTGRAGDPANLSWAARAESLEMAGTNGIQQCSTTGAGGASGCYAELVRAWRGSRRVEGEAGR
jgi:hypothetical protein